MSIDAGTSRFRDKRRHFLKILLGAAMGSPLTHADNFFQRLLPAQLLPWKKSAPIAGSIIGASANRGHRLRSMTPQAPTSVQDKSILIVGAGISGLVAAWQLKKSGFDDFIVLELEDVAGGNSRSGSNARSQFPWGAHYVPLPGKELGAVIELFEEFGIVTGRDADGNPLFDEYFLCAAPHERLKIHGRWQDGVIPQLGTTEQDRKEYKVFFDLMQTMRAANGDDGRPAFVIPVDKSSRDSRFTALDNISMLQFMQQQNLQSTSLLWYVDYCCRDDFGIGIAQTSAWAGIHYFAARKAHGDSHSDTVLTWPQGNGYLVQQLLQQLAGHVRTSSLVSNIEENAQGCSVDYVDVTNDTAHRINARHVIFAAPHFVAAHVVQYMRNERPAYLDQLHYSPWLVANISLRHLPVANGAPLSWDNVNHDSRSLGYVVATHQSLQQVPQGTVLTWYQPLDYADPKTARAQALETSHAQWVEMIAADLEKMHFGIRDDIESIDVCVWGHGMIAPVTGFMFSPARRAMQIQREHLSFAHTDMSGLSIFEEGVYHGIAAAQRAIAAINAKDASMRKQA